MTHDNDDDSIRKSVTNCTGFDLDEEVYTRQSADDNFNHGILLISTTTTKNKEEENTSIETRTDVGGTSLDNEDTTTTGDNNTNANTNNEPTTPEIAEYNTALFSTTTEHFLIEVLSPSKNDNFIMDESQVKKPVQQNVNYHQTPDRSEYNTLMPVFAPNNHTNESSNIQVPPSYKDQMQLQRSDGSTNQIHNNTATATTPRSEGQYNGNDSTYRFDTNTIEFNNNNNNNNSNDVNNNTPSRSASNHIVNNARGTGQSTDPQTVIAVPVKPIVLVTAQIYNNNEDTDDDNNINNSNRNESVSDRNGGVAEVEIIRNNNLPSTAMKPVRTFGPRRRKYCFFFSLLALVVVTLLLIGVGIYLRNDGTKTTNINSSEETQSIMEPSNVPTTSPTISHTPTIYRKPIQDRTELINVVDKYLFNTSDRNEIITTYGPIEEWDVSNVIEFQFLFSTVGNNKAIDFNADISKWDMRSATNVNDMFNGATKFNADLSKWDVSNVLLMSQLFMGATNFQSDLSRWNVTSAQYASDMFADAVHFNSDLSRWDVSNLLSMDSMFANAVSFRSDLSRWNVSSVTDMSFMFSGASNFVSDLSKWDTSSVTSLIFFAERVANFNTDVSKWNTSKVESFNNMFQLAGSFQGIGIDRWDVRTGILFDNMFTGARNFDANLSKWDTSNAITMEEMFAATNKFRGIGLEHWNLAKVTSTTAMFYDAIQFDCNISNWDVSNIANMTEMFARTTVFQGVGLDSWQLNETTETLNMFCHAADLNKTNIANWNVAGSDLFC